MLLNPECLNLFTRMAPHDASVVHWHHHGSGGGSTLLPSCLARLSFM